MVILQCFQELDLAQRSSGIETLPELIINEVCAVEDYEKSNQSVFTVPGYSINSDLFNVLATLFVHTILGEVG